MNCLCSVFIVQCQFDLNFVLKKSHQLLGHPVDIGGERPQGAPLCTFIISLSTDCVKYLLWQVQKHYIKHLRLKTNSRGSDRDPMLQ